MKCRIFCVFGLLVLVMSMWALPAAAQMTESEKAKAYASCIDELIDNCESKSAMMNTKSDNLREDVRIALMKASFYRKNREILIEELAERNVEPKSYKVQHFLNERFFAIVREHDPKVAEAYSEPDDVRIPAGN